MPAIFRAWLPLALSFLLMMAEGPALQAAIGRLPNPELNLASWGLTILLSLLVESPVIMLLATSIALVADRPSYRALRTFTLRLCLGATAATAAIAFTPLFRGISVGLMHQPENVVQAAGPAMQTMLLWSAAIGWRRFCQGVLVRHGRSALVSVGTGIRLLFLASSATALVVAGNLPGVRVAATAIMTGVLAEAAASTAFARPIVQREVLPVRDDSKPPLTQSSIFWFHLPLAATTLLTLLSAPMTSAALGRLPLPEATLAAWPVAFVVILVVRSGPLALQEIAVDRARYPESAPALRNFTWLIGTACSVLVVLLMVTPLLDVYLGAAIHLPEALRPMVRQAVGIMALHPLLTALGSWARGVLVARGRTAAIYQAMGLGLAVQGVGLAIGVLQHGGAMEVAAATTMLGAGAELALLVWRERQPVTG